MMPFLGFDFAKTLQSKKKRLETFANASLTSSDKKVREMCQTQQTERYSVITVNVITCTCEWVSSNNFTINISQYLNLYRCLLSAYVCVCIPSIVSTHNELIMCSM